ncbi:MAG: FAD-binding oxidoreductase [Thermoflexales bacterium]
MYDILIVGGGVMGCATATYLLRADPTLKVAVIERDSTYARSSTVLSDGNTRLQFNLKENIQMSQYGLEVLARFADDMEVDGDRPDVAFRQQGNLFIIDADSEAESRAGLALQQSLGCDVAWLTPPEIPTYFPPCTLSGCVGATFGPRDGTMSPNAVLKAYRRKAAALGARFIDAEVAAVLRETGRVTGVALASGERLSGGAVVNAAGPWAARVAKTAGVDLPVAPVKRQVFIVDTPIRPDRILPGVFFPSGLYLFHEGEGLFMVGKSLPTDPVTEDDFNWDAGVFESELWPELVELLPEFDRLKVLRGWAGLYEVNTLDENAILGEWPELQGFFLANGFSGHGFQQCHAVGRHMSELILGRPTTIDLSRFGPGRILSNTPVFESRRKII